MTAHGRRSSWSATSRKVANHVLLPTPSRDRSERPPCPRRERRRRTDRTSRGRRSAPAGPRPATRSTGSRSSTPGRWRLGAGRRAHPVLGHDPPAVPLAVVEEEQPEAGVVDRPRVEAALHLLEPGALGVEVPGGIGFGSQRLPEPPGHEVGDRRSRGALEHEPEQQRVVVVVLPR